MKAKAAQGVGAADPRLKTYTDEFHTPDRTLIRRWIFWSVVGFCLLQGLVFSFFAPYLIELFAVIPAFLALIVIWALPEARNVPTRFMERCFFSLFVVMIIWPNYLAVALPFLPWITLIRLISFPMALVFFVALSQSHAFRKALGGGISATPWLWRFMVLFVLVEVATMPLSPVLPDSLQRFVLSCINWLIVYFVAVYYFRVPGRVTRWAAILCAMAVFLGLIAIVEVHEGHVPWAYHIPSFLKVEDPTVNAVLRGGSRAYTGVYRAQTTFTTSLGYGEFIAVIFPFMLHFMMMPYKPPVRIAAFFASLFMVYAGLLSGSRSATLGALVAFMMTIGAWGVLKWRHERSSLMGAAVVYSYPVAGVLVLAATLLIGRLHRAVWGGGETVSSTLARQTQWHMTWPHVLKNPLGYGVGSAAEILQFRLPSGLLVLDSYFISLLLQFGPVGFIIFFGMMFSAVGAVVAYLYRQPKRDREANFLVPLSISLIVWFTVKSVNAEEGNHPLIFMMMGMISAMLYRSRVDAGGASGRSRSAVTRR